MTTSMLTRGRPLPTGTAVLRSLGLAGIFTVSVYLGRLTVLDGTGLSLVWPAAGVAALWFACQRRAGTAWLDYFLLALVTWVVNIVTEASPALAVVFVGANVVQVLVLNGLMRRWVFSLWGAGGDRPLTTLRQLGTLGAAVLLATAAAAAVGTAALALSTRDWSAATAAVWLVRNAVSIMLVLGIGLRVGYLVTAHRPETTAEGQRQVVVLPFRALTPVAAVELAVLLVVSAGLYLVTFYLFTGLPLAFPLVALTVWVAARFDTTLVLCHTLVLGGVAVVLTLGGYGPFAAIEVDATRALVVQAYVGITAVVGLTLAVGRDERHVLLGELELQAAGAEERTRQLELLGEASRALYTAEDVRAQLCRSAGVITGADVVCLLEPGGRGTLSTTAVHGTGVRAVTLPGDDVSLATVRAFAGRSLVFVPDAREAPEVAGWVRPGLTAASVAFQPVLSAAGTPVALVGLVWHERVAELPRHVRPVLQTLGSEAAAALDREELVHRLAAAAGKDALTGLPNRRRWDEALGMELSRADRTCLPLSVALLDLDHFKRYNDTHGHLAGDELLREFATAAQSHLRGMDMLARWGGEEFALVLPGCTAADALTVTRRLHTTVPRGETCTIGVAEWLPGESADDLMSRADRALYAGKAAGRNTTRADVQPLVAVPAARRG